MTPTVTKKRLLRAFSIPGYKHSDAIAVVNAYMKNNPVPPVWSGASVKGTFGTKIYRAWCRHIRRLRNASYRKGNSGHSLVYQVQTIYDFDLCMKKTTQLPSDKKFLVVDEFWRVFQ